MITILLRIRTINKFSKNLLLNLLCRIKYRINTAANNIVKKNKYHWDRKMKINENPANIGYRRFELFLHFKINKKNIGIQYKVTNPK